MGSFSRRTKAGSICLALLGAFGAAALVSGGSASLIAEPELSPSEVVALRFPTELEDATPLQVEASEAADPARRTLAMLAFNPDALGTSGLRTTAHPPGEAAGEPAEPPAAAVAQERTGSIAPVPQSRPAPVARPKRQPATLFNDAQIANIRERLKLTAEQAQYWPKVESALRYIGWRHSRDRTATSVPALDPNDVERLKLAAMPLIMTLREDQKREVRMLAHVMGLERVAAQF
jgi:hypothetical protein